MAPLVMGILNVTPDSFFDGGRFTELDKAVAHGLDMAGQGADIVDVGGESTRPGATKVSTDEEIERVVPVIEALAGNVRISVDTRNRDVAVAGIAAGASIINDVSASLWKVAADTGAGWIAMHMQGDPKSMQCRPSYGDVVTEVAKFLFERATTATADGVNQVWIDPGVGFGKTVDHNLSLLKHLDVLTSSAWPVVLGTSRKSFLGALGGEPAEDRIEGSLATAVHAAMQGVSVVRVHDVVQTVRALRVIDAVSEAA